MSNRYSTLILIISLKKHHYLVNMAFLNSPAYSEVNRSLLTYYYVGNAQDPVDHHSPLMFEMAAIKSQDVYGPLGSASVKS